MKITFHHPPTNTANPLKDFEPWNHTHYPDPKALGLYIYGIRLRVDGVLKFVPLVVGEGQLRKRLYVDHFAGKFANPLQILLGNHSIKSGDPKELWNFSKNEYSTSDIVRVYSETSIYDSPSPRATSKVALAATLQQLIFFQNADFFHLRHNIDCLPWKTDLKIEQSVYYLMQLSNGCVTNGFIPVGEHIASIVSTLNNFSKNFYYVYTPCGQDQEINALFANGKARKNAEYHTKEKLKLIGIHTTADADEDDGFVQIDLLKIQDDLINVGNHAYNKGNNSYNNPLIL